MSAPQPAPAGAGAPDGEEGAAATADQRAMEAFWTAPSARYVPPPSRDAATPAAARRARELVADVIIGEWRALAAGSLAAGTRVAAGAAVAATNSLVDALVTAAVTRARGTFLERAEELLDIDRLVAAALDGIDRIEL